MMMSNVYSNDMVQNQITGHVKELSPEQKLKEDLVDQQQLKLKQVFSNLYMLIGIEHRKNYQKNYQSLQIILK